MLPPSALRIGNGRRAAIFIDAEKDPLPGTLVADVCVVGSGPAALALARALAAADRTVVMIERGGSIARAPQRDVTFKSRPYDGIHNGIAFGYGGTGALWGGQLLPMLGSELAALGAPWNTDKFAEELAMYYRTIESWAGVTSTPYDGTLLKGINHKALGLKWRSFTPLFSKWIPFRRRNLGAAWMNVLRRSGRVRVVMNLMPVDWGLVDSGEIKTIRSVVCRSTNGQSTKVEAKYFVIAAGALESPLVLQRILGDDAADRLGVGRTLHDHLSLRVAEITEYHRDAFERLFSPFFTGTTMRSLRLCLPDGKDQSRAPWAYCHFVVEAPPDSGFAVARDFLRGLQAKDYKAAARALVNLPSAAGDIARMIWLRYVYRRLSISKGSRIFVNVDFVQSPSADNRVNSTAASGSERVVVDWNINEDIGGQIDRALGALTSFWDENQLHPIGKIAPKRHGNDHEQFLDNLYDIYHPAGTCSIGRVVDADLRIYGVSNGYVVGSSVFPMLGRSNPTLTIMALSLRLGATIAASFAGGK